MVQSVDAEQDRVVTPGPRATHPLVARLRSWNRPIPDDPQWVRKPDERARTMILDLALIAVVTTAVLIIVLRLWDASLRVPFHYSDDGFERSRDAKTIVETGWMQTTSRLGAPFGQEMYDFPISVDNGNFVIMRALAVVTSDWAVIINAFYLVTFYMAAWSSYLCMRWLRCGRVSAVSCSLLFTFAPYHFARVGHLLLSSYWVTPVAVLLAIRAAGGVPLVARRSSGTGVGWIRWHAGRSAAWVLLCLCCASFGPYYAFFALISIALAALITSASARTLRPLVAAGSYCAVIVGMFVFNLLPNLIYRFDHGVNQLVAKRQPIEFDIYGLRLIQLVTPVPGERIGFLKSISVELNKGYGSEGSQFFGLIGATGLVMLLGWLGLRVLRGEGQTRHDVRGLLALLIVAWILISTTGGLNWVATLVGFTQIRAWNRVSILLLFATLTWLALTVGPKVRAFVGDSRSRNRAAVVVAAGATVFGLYDQCSPLIVFDTKVYDATFESDKNFFARVEAQLPRGAMVYELPYRRFPEEPATHGSIDYDLYRPFLQTAELRWSYGGIKGRQSDWQVQLVDLPAEELTRDVLAVGFEGYVIDRAGYADFGAQIEHDIATVTGRSPLISPDGRWSFFDLTGLRSRFGTDSELQALSEQLLDAPRVSLEGCSAWEGTGSSRSSWCGATGTINVADLASDGAPARLRATVTAPAGGGTLELHVDGRTESIAIGPQSTALDLALPSGSPVDIEFRTDVPAAAAGGDPQDRRFSLSFEHVVAG